MMEPACNPYAHAGYMVCEHCGALGLPVEASWLDGRYILVTFAGPCRAVTGTTVVVAHEHMEVGK